VVLTNWMTRISVAYDSFTCDMTLFLFLPKKNLRWEWGSRIEQYVEFGLNGDSLLSCHIYGWILRGNPAWIIFFQKKSLRWEWGSRIGRYVGFCLDGETPPAKSDGGGEEGGALKLRHIVEAISSPQSCLSSANKAVLQQVGADWVMSHMWMSHVTHVKESCHTCEWVMSHILRQSRALTLGCWRRIRQFCIRWGQIESR